MRLTKEHSAQRRLTLLDAGTTLMVKKGYGGTGISEIAGLVGIPKGSFFNYFNSKEGFAVEAIHLQTQYALIAMRKFFQDERHTPLERLRKYYESVIRTYTKSMKFEGGCLLNILSLEMGEEENTITDTLKSCFTTLVDEIAGCIRLAQERNEIDPHHDPTMLATFINNSWRGFLTTSRSTKDAKAATAFRHYVFDYCLR